MKLTRGAALLAAVVLGSTTGCSIYFGDDDDCDYGYAEPAPSIGYIDPVTGQCNYVGGGGGGGGCYPRPLAGEPTEDRAAPDQALCETYCTGLDEATCLGTDGCRAGYIDYCNGGDCYPAPTFYTCWATAPSGPVQGGDCYGLDAYECSRHDDCSAFHSSDGGGTPPPADEAGIQAPLGPFEYCGPESTPPPPPTGSCYGDVLCDSLPPECPPGSVPGIGDFCWTGTCIAWSACEPPIDPGDCYGPVACLAAPPVCPEGSTAGIKDLCWSGYCIPLEQCEPPTPCESIGDEVACVSRTDCAPIYYGVNCTCPPGTEPMGDPGNSACTCEDWVFQSCTSGVQPF